MKKNNQPSIIDWIVDEKIGFGKAQIIPLIFLSLIDLNDGAQLVLTSFLTPVIQNQWGLNQHQISTLTSVFYLAIFMGSIISGKLSDQYGRKPLITYGSILQIVVSVTFFWVNDYYPMLWARFAYGFSYGFTISITTSMFAEIAPTKYRGKGILFLNFCVSVGKLYGLLLAYMFLDTFRSGNWRAMMILSCIPNIFVLYATYTVFYESPRYLIAKRQIHQAMEILEQMIKTNNPGTLDVISATQRKSVKIYYQKTFQKKQVAQFSNLFNQYYQRSTICLSLAWFSINFIYFGQLVVLPFIFGTQNKSFTSYTLTVLGEIPSFFISLLLVDRPNFGRKNSLKYFFVAAALMHFLFIYSPFVLFSSLCRLFMKMCFQMLYPCTTESYDTSIRTLGFGFNSAIGRLGAAIMPYIILPLVNTHISMISFILGVMALLGGISSWFLKYQTLGRELDRQTQSQHEEKQMDNMGSRLLQK